jgi:hypothetical protein
MRQLRPTFGIEQRRRFDRRDLGEPARAQEHIVNSETSACATPTPSEPSTFAETCATSAS